jgi:hypothetical protein
MRFADSPRSRRSFLAVAAGFLTAASASAQSALADPSASSAGTLSTPKHLAWIWNFTADGSPETIRASLAAHDLGVVVKTHDGVEWMATYDRSPHAITGPEQVRRLVGFFEEAGVPFHAWAVTKGRDPVREAEMAADVLSAGARSLILDLEPHSGFWEGSPEDALTFGAELRRRQPNGRLVVSIDPRPWAAERIPLREFASFSNEFAPQLYWDTFNTAPNLVRFLASGARPGPGGVTPQFLVDLSLNMLSAYGLPIQPVGQGSTTNLASWESFIDHGYQRGVETVSVWRYGVTPPGVLSVLRNAAPAGDPTLVRVPSVCGLKEGEAIASLLKAGLWVPPWAINYQGHSNTSISSDVLRGVEIGRVLSVRPQAGRRVKRGTEVFLAVRSD